MAKKYTEFSMTLNLDLQTDKPMTEKQLAKKVHALLKGAFKIPTKLQINT
jgi:hypothetical protein